MRINNLIPDNTEGSGGEKNPSGLYTSASHHRRIIVVPDTQLTRTADDRFYAPYTEAFKYLKAQGHEIAGHPSTVHVHGAWHQEDPEKWLSIIQIPVK